MRIIVLSRDCTGPNPQCERDARDGRTVHVIPRLDSGSLVMPTYHYASEAEGREAIERAHETAPVITTDDELYDARARGIPHKLSAGWIDPTMR